MKLSLLFPETRDVARVRDLAAQTEEQGFFGFWLGSSFGIDPFVALAMAGPATTRVQLGVAVVPTWPRHPVVMAQQAATASAATGGRFRLGIGASHKPVMGMYGIEFDRPIGHLREYLDVVRTLLADGKVAYEGDRYRVNAFLDVADAPAPPVLLGVLREQSARLAGGHAEGALSWLCPAGYLRDTIVPNIAKGASAANRAAPPFVAELPCALTNDRDAALAMAGQQLGVYPYMPFYRAIFEAVGIEVENKQWNAAMVDAAVIYGDEDAMAAKIRSFFDAGADEVVLSPFGVGDDPDRSQADCLRVLADLARG
jgi:F420-dependent oxidoreductase-like protein